MIPWRPSKHALIRLLALLILPLLVVFAPKGQAAAPDSANPLNSPYSQNFNTLANTGTANTWTDDSTLNGWYSNRTTYRAATGSDNTGALYSFGSAAATERALGSVASGGTGTILYGIRFVNNTGSTVSSLTVNYTGEQWRNGGNTTAQKLDFSYQVGATMTSLTAGTWTDFNTLDFTGPIATATAAALDGNAIANRVVLSQTISLSIPAGQEIMLRWSDVDDASTDHGLGVDDLSVSVPGGDVAPSVSSTVPTNGATGVAVNANLTVNFSESVTVDAGWFDIDCSLSGNNLAAAVSGSGSSRTLDPTADFTIGDSCTVTIDKDLVHDDDVTDPPDIMAADYVWSFTVSDQCNPSLTLIHTIQGSGAASGMDGSAVNIKGVVVGDFQGSTNLNGFFVQEENADADGNALTSEGIFVFAPSAGDVAVGDVVVVAGTVDEFFDLTELTSVTGVYVCGSGSATAATLTLPFPSNSPPYLERFEGMAVVLPQQLFVTEVFRLGRGGLVDMTPNQRLSQPTQVVEPGAPAIALQAANDLNRIIIDDGTRTQNPDPIIHPAPGLTASNTLRGGDSATGIQGVLTYSNHGWTETPVNDDYRVHPTTPPNFVHHNLRTTAPDTIAGTIRVASFNVLNYFTTLDTGASICGPGANQGCRGANSASELTRQRAKIVEAIVSMDADVVGLVEIENHASDAALNDLVSSLNAVAGAGTYQKISLFPLGGDAIKVAMIYQPASVTPVGSPATTSAGAFSARNRQPLAQTFTAGGQTFTVVINHFKSKGSDCDSASGPFPADPDTGDGQGNCNITRTMAAQALLTWLATNPTGSADPDILIMGDLNANAKEDPIDVLETANYLNLAVEEFGASGDYSYVFDGQWGSLDHAMASATIAGQVTGVTIWHINSDEPIALDYNTENKTAGQVTSLYNADEYRASDHDPVVVGLTLGSVADFSDLARSYGVAWHVDNSSVRLGATLDSETTFAANSDNSTDDGVTRGPGSGSGGNWNNGVNGASLNITVNGTGNGCLYAWVDWNNDGAFNRSTAVSNLEYAIRGVTTGSGNYPFEVPAGTFTGSGGNLNFAVRVRLYQNCSSGPSGIGLGGETEDNIFSFDPTAVTVQDVQLAESGRTVGVALLLVGLVLATGLFLVARRKIGQSQT